MSWKVHETDEVFAGLRGLCANSYRMYDPCEHRSYYDHDCETYECTVEEAAREYERLLRHCDHQRQELAKLRHPIEGEVMNERTKTEQGSSKVRAGSSITEELREFIEAHMYLGATALGGWKEAAFIIADRIDERHERGMADAELGASPTEEQMAELGWVKLPVDADGVPIHVGDELTNGADLPAKVRCMVLDESGWMVSTRELRGYGVLPATLHRVQPDSWENIIEDAANFALDTQHTAGRISLEPFVERCRRLAGERG